MKAADWKAAQEQLDSLAKSLPRVQDTTAVSDAAAASGKIRPATPLPWICPDHPAAQIRRSWDQTHYVMNGYPAGTGLRSNFKYECAECGRELASD